MTRYPAVAPRGRRRHSEPMEWGKVAGDILAGCTVAVFVALIAWLVTDRFAQRRESSRAQHDRNLAAAEELYAVYGQFFAAWKAWEFVRGRRRDEKGTLTPETRRELLEKAAEAEGRYESLIVRVAVEHRLSVTDRAALWSLRFALKELRKAIREDVPLGWWRTDDPTFPESHLGALKYLAFKDLTARVATIFVDAKPQARLPGAKERRQALGAVTATVSPHPTVGASRLDGRRWFEAATPSSKTPRSSTSA